MVHYNVNFNNINHFKPLFKNHFRDKINYELLQKGNECVVSIPVEEFLTLDEMEVVLSDEFNCFSEKDTMLNNTIIGYIFAIINRELRMYYDNIVLSFSYSHNNRTLDEEIFFGFRHNDIPYVDICPSEDFFTVNSNKYNYLFSDKYRIFEFSNGYYYVKNVLNGYSVIEKYPVEPINIYAKEKYIEGCVKLHYVDGKDLFKF